MDYREWMTQVLAERMAPTKTEFPENRAGRRAKARSTKKHGKGWTK